MESAQKVFLGPEWSILISAIVKRSYYKRFTRHDFHLKQYSFWKIEDLSKNVFQNGLDKLDTILILNRKKQGMQICKYLKFKQNFSF